MSTRKAAILKDRGDILSEIKKILETDYANKGIRVKNNPLGLSVSEAQRAFDELALDVVIPKFNSAVDVINQNFSSGSQNTETLSNKVNAHDDSIKALNMAVSQNTGKIENIDKNVLYKNNSSPYEPVEDYNPATRKFVTDLVSEAGGGDMLKAVYDTGNKGTDIYSYADSKKAEAVTETKDWSTNTFSNSNLLINTNFKKPVNQRGKTSYVNPYSEYIIDRWRDFTGGTVNITDNGMEIINTIQGGYVQLLQPLEMDFAQGTELALSWKNNRGVFTGTGVVGDKTSDQYFCVAQNTDGVYARCTYAKSTNLFVAEIITTEDITVEWIKLELGSVATPFIPRPYGEELALCQRYYFKESNPQFSPYSMQAIYQAVYANTLNGCVLFPCEMRVTPTIKNIVMRSNVDGTVLHVQTYIAQMNNRGINAIFNIVTDAGDFVAGTWYTLAFEADAELY